MFEGFCENTLLRGLHVLAIDRLIMVFGNHHDFDDHDEDEDDDGVCVSTLYINSCIHQSISECINE